MSKSNRTFGVTGFEETHFVMKIIHCKIHPWITQHLNHGIGACQAKIDFPHLLPRYPVLGSSCGMEDRERINAVQIEKMNQINLGANEAIGECLIPRSWVQGSIIQQCVINLGSDITPRTCCSIDTGSEWILKRILQFSLFPPLSPVTFSVAIQRILYREDVSPGVSAMFCRYNDRVDY